MSRSWPGRYRRRYASSPRSLFRKLLDYALTIAILGLLILVSARLDRVGTRQTTGDAVINDGDSLTLGGTERVRLRGIDAPEFNQVCNKDGATYPCGRRSREALVRLTRGRMVSCTGWERDRYGRLLGNCVAAGTDLNRVQVEAGWAVAYGDYFDEQEQARAKKLGLWAGSFDRPRDWRDSHGEMIESEHDLRGKVLNWLRQIFHFS
jgi:endonuclease YncB( thermonuclease family)